MYDKLYTNIFSLLILECHTKFEILIKYQQCKRYIVINLTSKYLTALFIVMSAKSLFILIFYDFASTSCYILNFR